LHIVGSNVLLPAPRLVGFAQAHFAARLFGPVQSYEAADKLLAQVFASSPSIFEPDLEMYASHMRGVVCLSEARQSFSAESFFLGSSVAWIAPALGDMTVPNNIDALVLDLRSLDKGATDLRQMLSDVVSQALTTPVPGPKQWVRRHEGLTSELEGEAGPFKGQIVLEDLPDIPATGSRDLPLVLITENAMPPEAVEIAATLRIADRATIVGSDLATAVAEAKLFSADSTQIAVRYRDLGDGKRRWPDIIPADRPTRQPTCVLRALSDIPATVTPFVWSPANRLRIRTPDPSNPQAMGDLDRGQARAALALSFGAANSFHFRATQWPGFDPGLLTKLEIAAKAVDAAPATPSIDRATLRDALRLLTPDLFDGQSDIRDLAEQPKGWFPVMIDESNGKPVVRRSAVAGVMPGDVITSIGGIPFGTFYAKEVYRTSAAQLSYAFQRVVRRMLALDGPTTFQLVDPDGKAKTVTVDPQPEAAMKAFGFAPSVRPSGFLGDLGAPTLYYLNLDGMVTADIQAFRAALANAAGASGLVLDLRGVPSLDVVEVAQRLMDKPFKTPEEQTPLFVGLGERTAVVSAPAVTPLSNPSFAGPIALLIGSATIGAAERLGLTLVDANRASVLGRTSAGTAGHSTGVRLPNGFGFTFTVSSVYRSDTLVFKGLSPNVIVEPTIADLRDGIDTELTAAISSLQAP